MVYNLHGDHPREIVTDSLKMFKRYLVRCGFPEKVVILPDINESRSSNWDILLS